jgi:hypothetical protein
MPSGRRQLAALASIAFALGVAACGSDDEKRTTSSSASAPPTRSTPPPSAAQPPVQRPAPIRTTQTVQAASGAPNRPKTTLKVKVVRLVRGLRPNSFQFGGSQKGLRFVGVQVTFVNVGRATWTGAPGKDSVLITSSDTQASGIMAAATCGGTFATKVELLPGERQRGCLPFVMEKRRSPKLFQFSPDSPATPPVEWRLTR